VPRGTGIQGIVGEPDPARHRDAAARTHATSHPASMAHPRTPVRVIGLAFGHGQHPASTRSVAPHRRSLYQNAEIRTFRISGPFTSSLSVKQRPDIRETEGATCCREVSLMTTSPPRCPASRSP
jgi:hypothetical protein